MIVGSLGIFLVSSIYATATDLFDPHYMFTHIDGRVIVTKQSGEIFTHGELKELKAFAEQIADEITAIEDLIKAEMTERNTEEMTVDVFKIRWTRMTSSRFDSASFKKTHAALYAQYIKQTESRRFSIA